MRGVPDFVHLHGHSPWSLLDGAAPIEAVMRRCLADGQKAVSFTDHGVLYGVVEAYKTARRLSQETGQPFKYIPGVEAYVAPRSRFDKDHRAGDDANTHMVFWALSNTGLQALFKLVSRAELYRKPRIDLALVDEIIQEVGHGHLAASTACLGSEWSQAILQGRHEQARVRLGQWAEVLGRDNLYLELQEHGIPEQRTVNRELLDWAERFRLPLIATNDFHYMTRENAAFQNVLMCVSMNKRVGEGYQQPPEMYVKTRAEMAQLFGDIPEALANTVAIAERCDVSLAFGQTHLPSFPLPEGYTSAAAYLRHLAYSGARRRYPDGSNWDRVTQRLDYELNVIESMGYPDYFLIVADFIQFARDRGIPVGPGRGSSAGSLVAYCTGITNVDPLRYGLLFERFLNPERVTLPDIDIDFCYHRRNEVIEYVSKKYGEDRVAQIITFGTLKPRAAIRDVARALNVPVSKADQAAKAVPFGVKSLSAALSASADLRNMVEQDEQIRRVVELAENMEGYPRHASIHAAGVIIAPRPLEGEIPLTQPDSAKVVTKYATQWPFTTVEELGYVKMDFLALRNLSVIQEAVEWVARNKGVHIDLDKIPLNDERALSIFQRGLTGGVFQFESEGMRNLLQEFVPDSLEHLIMLNAMYRPGPMQHIPEAVARRHGREAVQYPHPDLEALLHETYGIMVYQEDIMNVAQRFAGFTLGQADLLRRAMGKKKPEEMAKAREQFVQGAVAKGYSAELANRLFNDMEPFAGYAFPKAHATAYAIVAYQTAWLKAHYPSEYMAALLTSVMGKNKNIKLGEYLDECRHMGLVVRPPDVNTSGIAFTPLSDGSIGFGLSAVKNVGDGAVAELVAEREARGPYTSFFDFCCRVGGRGGVTKEAVLSLIRVGAFDAMGVRRAQLEVALDETWRAAANEWKRDKSQMSLFGAAVAPSGVPLPDVPEHPAEVRLAAERELVGIYLSGHPLDQYRERLPKVGILSYRELQNVDHGERVRVAGVVTDMRKIVTRGGDEMAFVTVEDLSGPIELVLFPRLYQEVRPQIYPGALLAVQGRNDSSHEAMDEVIPSGADEADEAEDAEVNHDLTEGAPDADSGEAASDPSGSGEGAVGYVGMNERVFVAKVIAEKVRPLGEVLARVESENRREAHRVAKSPEPGVPVLRLRLDGLTAQQLLTVSEVLREAPGGLPVILGVDGATLLAARSFWVNADKMDDLVGRLEALLGSGRVVYTKVVGV